VSGEKKGGGVAHEIDSFLEMREKTENFEGVHRLSELEQRGEVVRRKEGGEAG